MKRGGMFIIAQGRLPHRDRRHAHLVLPAAQWGEMNLTSINGERRLRLYERFMDPPGEAIPGLGHRRALRETPPPALPRRPQPLTANRFLDFDWRSDEDVFIHARYQFDGGPGDPMEGYAGVTYDLLRRLGNEGIQTPVRMVNRTPSGTVRLHEDGRFFTPSGKARFVPAPLPGPDTARRSRRSAAATGSG